MTNYCSCGHLPSDHEADRGRCSGSCFDSDYGTFSCLPTPRATQFGRGSSAHANGTLKSGRALEQEVAMLPTPSASDGAGGKTSRSGARKGELLLGGLVRTFSDEPMLPTPRATRGGSSTETANLLPTPQTVNRASRRAMLGIPDPEGNRNHWAQPGLEQALEIAQGILPKEFESWDEVPGGSRPPDEGMALLPTPQARDFKGGSAESHPGQLGWSLPTAVENDLPEGNDGDLLPTPAARDFKGVSSPAWRNRPGVKGTPTLPDALFAPDRPAEDDGQELLPTPTAMDTMQSGDRTLEWWDGWRDRMKREGYGPNGMRGDSLGAAAIRMSQEADGE